MPEGNDPVEDEAGVVRRGLRRENSEGSYRRFSETHRVAPDSSFVLSLITVIAVVSLSVGFIYAHFLQINQTKKIGECVAALLFLDLAERQALSEEKVASGCDLSIEEIQKIKSKLRK